MICTNAGHLATPALYILSRGDDDDILGILTGETISYQHSRNTFSVCRILHLRPSSQQR